MCGIAGIIDLTDKPIEPGLLLAMNQAIAHRGPDDEGYLLICRSSSRYSHYAGPCSSEAIRAELPTLFSGTAFPGANIGLGHRRFSIIDLSADGHQPFFDRDRTCCVVFNGEIYNYIELRDELTALGARFRTQSDTEVLLEAYKQWGTDCFSRLNGFWAIALYDFEKKQLLLSRDRIGKKPLYWSKIGSRVYFASEIKALLQVPEIYRNRKVNEEAIFYWLVCRRRDMNFSTCFEGIYSLPSACWTVIDTNFPNKWNTFWTIPKERASEQDVGVGEATATLRDILQDAVRIRLRADVPLGIELSGGLDSSALAALASQSYAGKLSTYTVRFPELNEEPFARSVARHYNLDYHVLESPTENFFNQILSFTHLEEEPYHAPNLQTNQMIWAQMRAAGTKVSLNGAGGDENFAGYAAYALSAQIESVLHGRIAHYFKNAFCYSEGRTGIRILSQPLFRLGKHLFEKAMTALTSKERMQPAHSYFRLKAHSKLPEPLTLSDVLYSDMTNTLMPYWMRSGDKGFMGIPIEVRAPFLDYRVVDFAFQLPTTYLFRDGWHKWILRKAMQDLLPADVVWRRHKLGFPFPFARFYSECDEIIELIVNHSSNPYLDFSQKARFRNDWTTVSFILWYELFFNENIGLFQKIEEKARQLQPASAHGHVPQFLSTCHLAGGLGLSR
jgi:asparagine synthase (glutamine-hydrolysing)